MASNPSAQFSLTLRVVLDRRPGALARVAQAIGDAGGSIGAVDIVEQRETETVRELTVDASDADHWNRIVAAVEQVESARLIETTDRTLELHRGGKVFTGLKTGIKTRDDLSMAYTPGVARVCLEIEADRDKAHEYTIKKNTVAVVSDGTAVLGLGDIGPEAAMPVMEGKAVLFKEFADVDAFPICLDTTDADEIVAIVKALAPTFGGINLEDISSPRCFEIENRLIDELDIPVFHDDQHGTAIVTLAALLNACRLTGRRIEDLRVAMVGAGAAGVAVTRILMGSGVTDIVAADRRGAIHRDRPDYREGSMNAPKTWLAEHTNDGYRDGTPAEILEGADLFIGLSGPGVITARDLERMNTDPIVFAMANPTPEVTPEEASPLRARPCDRPLGLPEPDQQRARVPGHLPRRAGRARAEDHRGDEARGRARDRVGRRRRRAVRGLHHPERLQPRREPRRRDGRSPRGRAQRDRARRPHSGTPLTERTPLEGRRDRSDGHDRAGARSGAARAWRRCRRPLAQSREDEPDARRRGRRLHLVEPGERARARRAPSRAPTPSCTWPASPSTSAGATTPRSGSARRASSARATSWPA